MDVTTLFVISGRPENAAHADDLVQALRVTCEHPQYTVVVDESGKCEPAGEPGIAKLPSPLPEAASGGFHRAAGIRFAIDHDIRFQQAILLSDDCLLLNSKLDSWAGQHTGKEHLGVMGVQDRQNYDAQFRKATGLFVGWEVPHERWERTPMVLDDTMLFIPARAAALLYQANRLTPPECEEWPTHFGAYVSWIAQMSGFRSVAWGFMDKQLPPLFAHYRNYPLQPAPHILSSQFLLYASARSVPGYREGDLRTIYRRMRGEQTATTPVHGPAVSGDPN